MSGSWVASQYSATRVHAFTRAVHAVDAVERCRQVQVAAVDAGIGHQPVAGLVVQVKVKSLFPCLALDASQAMGNIFCAPLGQARLVARRPCPHHRCIVVQKRGFVLGPSLLSPRCVVLALTLHGIPLLAHFRLLLLPSILVTKPLAPFRDAAGYLARECIGWPPDLAV